ncbi:MAG: cytochrome-c peroxidase [Saprospiraceae bacterium]|nr:cytochrome-c peroxidase [Saprospiraceae bacterium]
MTFAVFLLFGSLCFLASCDRDDTIVDQVVYDTTPFQFTYGNFPDPDLPSDNPLSIAGVELGRMLFYEKMLSKDGSQACASCHLQTDAFTDIRQFSVGVEGLNGKRQAMAAFNLAWHQNGFFWDGRAPGLRDQSLMPIQDPLEMNETLEGVILKLSGSTAYRDQFVRAFENGKINALNISLALEQFMFTIVSVNSRYDQFVKGEVELSESEQRGYDLFFTEYDPWGSEKGGECFHCHAGFNFTNDRFMNNGLDAEAAFTDEGRFKVTGDPADRAKFKVPSLRNIALTAPYMHDGRFATLEEVLDHYIAGVKDSPTVDPLMQYNLNPGLDLDAQDKQDLINFLQTLTDLSLLDNAAYTNPF